MLDGKPRHALFLLGLLLTFSLGVDADTDRNFFLEVDVSVSEERRELEFSGKFVNKSKGAICIADDLEDAVVPELGVFDARLFLLSKEGHGFPESPSEPEVFETTVRLPPGEYEFVAHSELGHSYFLADSSFTFVQDYHFETELDARLALQLFDCSEGNFNEALISGSFTILRSNAVSFYPE